MGKDQRDLMLLSLPLLILRTEGESYQSCCCWAELFQDLEPKAISHFYKALLCSDDNLWAVSSGMKRDLNHWAWTENRIPGWCWLCRGQEQRRLYSPRLLQVLLSCKSWVTSQGPARVIYCVISEDFWREQLWMQPLSSTEPLYEVLIRLMWANKA